MAVKIQIDERSTPFIADRGKADKGNRTQLLGAGALGEECPGYIHVYKVFDFKKKRTVVLSLSSDQCSLCLLTAQSFALLG